MGAAAAGRGHIHIGAWALIGLAAALSLGYVLVLQDTPESLPRSAVKTASVAAFVAVALMERGPRLLALGLAFGALGDWFMSLDGPRWFAPGLGSFLIGHLFYIALFVREGMGAAAMRAPWRAIAIVAIGVGAGGMLIASRTWLGGYFELAAIYTTVIGAMTISALTLPSRAWPAMIGAVLFLISDGLLTLELFRREALGTHFETLQFFAWATYWGGQLGLCLGGLRLRG